MSPRSSNVRIQNTVADATMVNNPKVNSTTEYNHACIRRPRKRRQTRDGQCTQKVGCATKTSTNRARQYKHDSIESSFFANPSKEEVTNPKIYPLTVTEIVDAYNAHAKLKTLL
jgi:hypothetical protein